jgi:hypothetical protein
MLNNRKTMRNNLNKLDFDIEYLKRKKDLTEVEKRVLNKILYIEKEVQTDPIVNIFNLINLINFFKFIIIRIPMVQLYNEKR